MSVCLEEGEEEKEEEGTGTREAFVHSFAFLLVYKLRLSFSNTPFILTCRCEGQVWQVCRCVEVLAGVSVEDMC